MVVPKNRSALEVSHDLEGLDKRSSAVPAKKTKWLMYTVLVGLIPIIFRMCVWALSETRNTNFLSTADFVLFGLILHISIVNELEHFDYENKSWKTVYIGLSIVLIAFYGLLYAIDLLGTSNPGLVREGLVTYACLFVNGVSFFLGVTVLHRISKLAPTQSYE